MKTKEARRGLGPWRASESVRLGGLNASEDNNQAPRYQQIWLARRLRVSRELAAVLAELTFQNKGAA